MYAVKPEHGLTTHHVEQLIVLESLGGQARVPVGEIASSALTRDAAGEVDIGGNPEERLPHVRDFHAHAHETCQVGSDRIDEKVYILSIYYIEREGAIPYTLKRTE